MCFGQCPVYQVTFRADGQARWNGEYFSDRIGRFLGRIESDVFSRLATVVERSGFFHWAPEYSEMVSDNPTYRIRVVRDGVAKEVLQYATDEPPGFTRLASRIDRVADAIAWTKVDEEVSPPAEREPWTEIDPRPDLAP
jgi:hypothetical protein